MIQCTAPLRKRVREDLAKAQERAADNPDLKLAAEISRLKQLSQTPWLFVGRGAAGTVSGFTGNGRNRGLLNVARVAARRAQLPSSYSQLSLS